MTDHVTPTDERLADVAATRRRGRLARRDAQPQPLPRPRRVPGRHARRRRERTRGVPALRRGRVRRPIQSVGGEILWATDAAETVIGCDHDVYDEVVAVWYPSRAAFLALADFPGYMEAHAHRDAAIEQAALIATRGDAEPRLTQPFSA